MIMALQHNNELFELENYRLAIQEEMIKMGASKQELDLIKDATIRNAIKRKRKPEDVAWAILQ
ncbi:MAG: hypothetical protein K1W19_03320 [Lachnospiraceae bacterium]